MRWMLWITGALFCISGCYFFYKSIFEENRSMKWSFIILGMGIVLIGLGTAKALRMI